jgi:hypothetical protein
MTVVVEIEKVGQPCLFLQLLMQTLTKIAKLSTKPSFFNCLFMRNKWLKYELKIKFLWHFLMKI